MADTETLARPYAQAIYDLALESKALDAWLDGLNVAAAVAEDQTVQTFIGDPVTSDANLLATLTKLMDGIDGAAVFSSDNGSNLLRLLIENGRLNVLPEIARLFADLKAEQENVLEAVVTTATELSTDELSSIESALAAKLGKTIKLSTVVNKDLVGGAVIRAGDFVIDGSVSARLARLATALIN